jgi:hypothetical protein
VKILSVLRLILKQAMNQRISGREDFFTERTILGCAMSVLWHSEINSTATTASRFISMKVSTKLTMGRSGFFVRNVTNGTIQTAKSYATTIKH